MYAHTHTHMHACMHTHTCTHTHAHTHTHTAQAFITFYPQYTMLSLCIIKQECDFSLHFTICLYAIQLHLLLHAVVVELLNQEKSSPKFGFLFKKNF